MDTDVEDHWKEPSFRVLISESTGDTRGTLQNSVSFLSLETFWIWIHHEIVFGHLNLELDNDHDRKKAEIFGGLNSIGK